jgi:MarR family transcriptional regulator, organic hydroperoxide resistance regulator
MASKSAFGFITADESPGFLLWQTTVLWQRLIKKALKPYAISHTQQVILAILLWLEEHAHKATQITIARWSKLDKMTISIALKNLSTRGLVERAELAADSRAKQATLTEKGKTLARELVPLIEKIDAAFFGNLSKTDETELLRILGCLIKKQNEDTAPIDL